jgi:hypothetical protein
MSEAHDLGLAVPNWYASSLESVDTAASLSGMLIDEARRLNGVVAREAANVAHAWLDAIGGPPTSERLRAPLTATLSGAREISMAHSEFCRTLAAHWGAEVTRSLGLLNGPEASAVQAFPEALPATGSDHEDKDACCANCTSKACSRQDPFHFGIHGEPDEAYSTLASKGSVSTA